jgi:hypothetical protein
MEPNSVSHPSEDLLEKFARNRCSDQEIELVETHVLACSVCVTKLEDLDNFLAAFRPGYQEFLRSRTRTKPLFNLRWAYALAAVAVLGIGVSVMPRQSHPGSLPYAPAAQLQLSSQRGNEAATAPASRPLQVHLVAPDLPQAALAGEVVTSVGSSVWKGSVKVAHDEASVSLPALHAGAYFLRLYGNSQDQSDLLREFAFQVK